MTKLFSPSTSAFYDSVINAGSLPSDAVAITDQLWSQMLEDQSNGMQITAGSGGLPVASNPTYSPAQQAASAAEALIASGLTVTSTGSPAINGTYSLSPAAQSAYDSVMMYIQVHGTFPRGMTTTSWPDIHGDLKVFPNVTTFTAFATAAADFIDQVDDYANGVAGTTLPSSSITIA